MVFLCIEWRYTALNGDARLTNFAIAVVFSWRQCGPSSAGTPPPFLELRIIRDLRTPISVSAENEEVTDSGFRLKTGKTRCWLVTAHCKGFTRAKHRACER